MKLIYFLIIAFLLSGCTTFQPPEVCDGGPSAILTVTKGNPSGLDRALLILNVAALEKKAYTKDDAVAFIQKVRSRVESGISYVGLLDFLNVNIAQVNKAAGLTVIILGSDVPAVAKLGGTMLISKCDKELILAHLAKQDLIAGMY